MNDLKPVLELLAAILNLVAVILAIMHEKKGE